MKEVMEKENIKIENMIYEIRGKQVMLDSDLARLYQVQTKRINEAVKNNLEKFPERFSFILDDIESQKLLNEIFVQKKETRGGRYKNPRVFTEQGVAMLATILKSKAATQVSIAIMDAFVEMKKYISKDLITQKYYNYMIIRHDSEIKILQESFVKLKNANDCDGLFFKGQIYDAYSLLLNMFKKSKENIIIINNYVDKSILDVLSKINKKVLIVTNKFNNEDYRKYKMQYKKCKYQN